MAKVDRYIECFDFKAGIFGDQFSAMWGRNAQSANPTPYANNSPAYTYSRGHTTMSIAGAASEQGTWGCYADPVSGALVPLPDPQLLEGLTVPDFGEDDPAAGDTVLLPNCITDEDDHYPIAQRYWYVADIQLASPMMGGLAVESEGLAVAFYYLYSNDGTGDGTYDSYRWGYLGRLFVYTYDNAPNYQPALNRVLDFALGRGVELGNSDAVLRGGFGGACLDVVQNIIFRSENDPGLYPLPFLLFSFPTPPRFAAYEDFDTAVDADDLLFSSYDPVGSGVNADSYSGNSAGVIGLYPNPTTFPSAAPNTYEVYDFAVAYTNSDLNVTPLRILVLHQGRIVGIKTITVLFDEHYSPLDWDNLSQAPIADETLWYTEPNNVRLIEAGDEGNPMFHSLPNTQGSPTGIGSMASVNVSELFCVKHKGGAMIVRGELDNPTFVSLPFVESSFGVNARGVSTPIGYIYLSTTGVHTWQGDVVSTHISPQLSNRFWDYRQSRKTGEELPYRNKGSIARLAYAGGFVAVPKGWLFDIRSQGWWRMDDPDDCDTYAYYESSTSSDRLWAMPYRIGYGDSGVESQVPRMYDFENAPPRQYYKWTSQPLIESQDHTINFTEFELILQDMSNDDLWDSGLVTGDGVCFVTVTLSGFDDMGTAITPVVTQFDISGRLDGTIKRLRADINPNFIGRYVTVTIEAQGGTYTTGSPATVHAFPAPKVYGFRLGIADRTTPIKER